MKTINQKSIYFWNLMGNMSAAAVSVVYLLIVSRFFTNEIADMFSLAYAVGHLWVVIGLFQVRNYQGTDVKGEHLFLHYLQGRALTILLMIVSFFPYVWMTNSGNYTIEQWSIVTSVMLYRVCDALSDVCQGLFQQHGRLDIAGKLMTYRYMSSILFFGCSVMLFRSVSISLIMLFLWNILFVLLGDVRYVRKIEEFSWLEVIQSKHVQGTIEVLRACVPLFINGFLLNYVLNEPKLIIDRGISQGILISGMQRDFNILFLPVFFMSLCILVVRPLITKLAELWHAGNKKLFDTTIVKLIITIFLGTFVITGLTYIMGIPVLSLLFSVDLSDYVLPLCILMFSGGIYAMAIIFENIVTIVRMQKYLVAVYVCMFILSKIITEPLIYQYQMLGASVSFGVVMIAYILGSSILILKIRKEGNV